MTSTIWLTNMASYKPPTTQYHIQAWPRTIISKIFRLLDLKPKTTAGVWPPQLAPQIHEITVKNAAGPPLPTLLEMMPERWGRLKKTSKPRMFVHFQDLKVKDWISDSPEIIHVLYCFVASSFSFFFHISQTKKTKISFVCLRYFFWLLFRIKPMYFFKWDDFLSANPKKWSWCWSWNLDPFLGPQDFQLILWWFRGTRTLGWFASVWLAVRSLVDGLSN